MQTIIRCPDFALTASLDRFIREQARQSLRACADRVGSLMVGLKDINGPKGGNDKECIVKVDIPGHAPVVVSKRSKDAYASIRYALDRASRTALRRLNKRCAKEHGGREQRISSQISGPHSEPLPETAFEDVTDVTAAIDT